MTHALGSRRDRHRRRDFDLTFDVLLKSVFLGIKHAATPLAYGHPDAGPDEQEFVVDGGISAGPSWSRFPEAFRTTRPIRHHRPPGR